MTERVLTSLCVTNYLASRSRSKVRVKVKGQGRRSQVKFTVFPELTCFEVKVKGRGQVKGQGQGRRSIHRVSPITLPCIKPVPIRTETTLTTCGMNVEWG